MGSCVHPLEFERSDVGGIAVRPPLLSSLTSRIVAAAVLLSCTPVFICVVLLRLFGRRRAVFTSALKRGTRGRTFRLRNFWTAGPECLPGADPLSAALLRTRLARLPEFWSVLAGDMQLVGVRPAPAGAPRRPGMEVFDSTPPGLVDFGRMLCPAPCEHGEGSNELEARQGRIDALNQYWIQIRSFRVDALVLLWSAGQAIWPSLFDCESAWRVFVGSPPECVHSRHETHVSSGHSMSWQ